MFYNLTGYTQSEQDNEQVDETVTNRYSAFSDNADVTLRIQSSSCDESLIMYADNPASNSWNLPVTVRRIECCGCAINVHVLLFKIHY